MREGRVQILLGVIIALMLFGLPILGPWFESPGLFGLKVVELFMLAVDCGILVACAWTYLSWPIIRQDRSNWDIYAWPLSVLVSQLNIFTTAHNRFVVVLGIAVVVSALATTVLTLVRHNPTGATP